MTPNSTLMDTSTVFHSEAAMSPKASNNCISDEPDPQAISRDIKKVIRISKKHKKKAKIKKEKITRQIERNIIDEDCTYEHSCSYSCWEVHFITCARAECNIWIHVSTASVWKNEKKEKETKNNEEEMEI